MRKQLAERQHVPVVDEGGHRRGEWRPPRPNAVSWFGPDGLLERDRALMFCTSVKL